MKTEITQSTEQTLGTISPNIKTTKHDTLVYLVAVIITVVSALLLMYDVRYYKTSSGNNFFILNYVLLVVLVIYSIVNAGVKSLVFKSQSPTKFKLVYPVMVASLISCFGLNREIPIFFESCQWLSIILVLISVNILCLPFRDKLPNVLKYISFGFVGIACMIYLYFALVLLPWYIIGCLGVIALGLGIHVFVPVMSLITLLLFLKSEFKLDKRLVYASYTAMIITIVTITSYCFIWNIQISNLNEAKMKQALLKPSDLPEWVDMAQRIPVNNLTKKIILSDLLYVNGNDFWGGIDFFDMPNRNLNEDRFHDPLIMIATSLNSKIQMADEEKIKILESTYNARHLTENRLWTGKDLETQSVVTNVRIYPQQRMSYTEKTLTILNTDTEGFRPQEAIYSFYLPQGSAVSSLSLWIKGKEELGYLTTKGKADSAYKTIVGVENRDPSVVHWQEGNRVSVRVFPCDSKEARQFKIGVSSPLQFQNNKLQYTNLSFKGPNATGAREMIKVELMGDIQNPEIYSKLKAEGNRVYTASCNYNDDWSITFDALPIQQSSFSFDNTNYLLSEAKTVKVHFKPESYYLDVNKTWEKEEWNNLIQLLKGETIYVFNNEMQKITPNNEEELFIQCQQKNFSIFPFYEITNPDKCLVISKSNKLSPNLNELSSSVFMDKTKTYFSKNQKLRVLHIGNSLSPYLQSLSEFRALHLYSSSFEEINKIVAKEEFIVDIENDATVFIPNSNIMIQKIEKKDTLKNSAPDHVLRLFAYNTILKKMNTNALTKLELDDNCMHLASVANVVSPVSSLVVLESVEDYKRFNIEKNKNSIENASMHNSGAVPEPHEWVLIILVGLSCLYLIFKKKNLQDAVLTIKK